MSLTAMGSFEAWSNLVRSSIVWCGQPDPCGARVTEEQGVDSAAEAHMTLLSEWGKLLDASGLGLSCGQVLGQIKSGNDALSGLAEAIISMCESNGQLPVPTVMGKALKKAKGRVRRVGGRKLRLACKQSCNKYLWKVECIDRTDAPVATVAAADSHAACPPTVAKPAVSPDVDDDDDDDVPF
jgi:putative DNA primase/helicase